jgi:hypothetical protein
MLMKFSTGSTVMVAKDVLYCDMAGEVAILNLKDENYYVLKDMGVIIWNLIQKPNTIKKVLEVIVKEYAVEQEECKQDLMELIQDLLDKGLVEIKTSC